LTAKVRRVKVLSPGASSESATAQLRRRVVLALVAVQVAVAVRDEVEAIHKNNASSPNSSPHSRTIPRRLFQTGGDSASRIVRNFTSFGRGRGTAIEKLPKARPNFRGGENENFAIDFSAHSRASARKNRDGDLHRKGDSD